MKASEFDRKFEDGKERTIVPKYTKNDENSLPIPPSPRQIKPLNVKV